MEPNAKIILEPELEMAAATLTAAQCRALARIYNRWSRQLRVKARIIELHESPSSKRRLPFFSPAKARLN